MPPKSQFPTPSKRFVSGAWVIYWRYSPQKGVYRQYTVSTGLTRQREDASEVDLICRQFASALAGDRDFPPRYAETDAIIRYLDDKFGKTDKPGIPDSQAILEQYNREMISETGKEWAGHVKRRLEQLSAAAGGDILAVTPEIGRQFLLDILAKGRTAATRNRALNVFTKFYKRAVELEYIQKNPFAAVKLLKEVRPSAITYCTRAERARIINMARKAGFPDWIGVPIAFFTGMRMEEITRMRWDDIRWDEERIVVPITKTKKPRVVDMSPKLRAMLALTPQAKRNGYVVPDIPGVASRRDRAQTLVRMLQKIAATEPNPVPAKCISWNPWRHTFATLLVQEGIPIETVSNLMGNTPEVCRRHYAQFMPKDKKLEAINRL